MIEDSDNLPADAFFSPDDPIIRTETRIEEGAFFNPDDPIVRKGPIQKPDDYEDVVGHGEDAAQEDVVVTGMGMDAHLNDPQISELARYGDHRPAR